MSQMSDPIHRHTKWNSFELKNLTEVAHAKSPYILHFSSPQLLTCRTVVVKALHYNLEGRGFET
jgi:hypothetical protein